MEHVRLAADSVAIDIDELFRATHADLPRTRVVGETTCIRIKGAVAGLLAKTAGWSGTASALGRTLIDAAEELALVDALTLAICSRCRGPNIVAVLCGCPESPRNRSDDEHE